MNQKDIQSVDVNLIDENGTRHIVFHQSNKLGISLPHDTPSDVIDTVNKAHIQILPFERELMQWLAASDKNAQLFCANPFKALEVSGIKIPEEVISNLKNASQALLLTLKK